MMTLLTNSFLTCQYADAGCEGEHEADHHPGEVDGGEGVQDDEDALVVDVLDTVPEADREDAGQDVQVEEEAEPSGGLVLRHTGGRRVSDVFLVECLH